MPLAFEKKEIRQAHWTDKNLTVVVELPALRGTEQILTGISFRVSLDTNQMGGGGEIGWAHLRDPPGSVLSGQQLTFLIPIGLSKLTEIEHVRQKMGRTPRDVHIFMEGWLSYIAGFPEDEKNPDRTKYQYEPFSDTFNVYEMSNQSLRIPETDWLEMYRRLGKSVASLVVTDRTARGLLNLRSKLGVTDDESFADRIMETFSEVEKYRSGLEVNQTLIWTLPEDKNIRNKAEEILIRAAGDKAEVMICGYVDGALEPRLGEILKQGGKIRIIVRKGGIRGKDIDPAVREVIERLKQQRAQIEYRNLFHARALISKGECIVSSADLNTHSLDKNREIGIYTTDPSIVERAKTFFEKVWGEE